MVCGNEIDVERYCNKYGNAIYKSGDVSLKTREEIFFSAFQGRRRRCGKKDKNVVS